MSRTGRPHGTSKEGTHRHPGGMRWHSLEQKHHDGLHDRFSDQIEVILIKHETPTDVENLHAPDFEKEDDGQLSLLKDIEEGLNIALALELIDEIIKTKLTETNEAEVQWGTDGPPYKGRDKAEPFGEPDVEEREPNTIGLP